jgi:FkbM family methyltransferase
VNVQMAALYLNTVRRYRDWPQIIRSMLNGSPGPGCLRLRNGVRFKVPPASTGVEIINEVFFSHVYTPKFLPVEKGDIVVDIGANIGVFSVFASARGAAQIYAFEPFRGNFDFLRENIALNGMDNIIPIHEAVSGKAGIARLYLAGISGGHLLFDHCIDGKLDEYVEVPAITLPAVMDDRKLDRIDYLKIDCEGSEGAILESLSRDYLRRVRKIGMEFHDNVSSLSHGEMECRLRSAGFETHVEWDGKSPFGYIHAKRM